MPYDSQIGYVDAVIDIVKNSSGTIPADSGIPTGDFVYADYNSNGNTLETTKQEHNITVGDGTMLQSILKENGNKIESALKDVGNKLVDNSIKHIQKMVSFEKTFDTALGTVKTSLDSNGLKFSTHSKNLVKTLENKDMSPKVTVDTSSLAKANNKIAEGMSKQKVYHEQQIEKLNFEKSGEDSLKDSNGKKISPRNAVASHNAEKAIETKDMNNTTVDNILEFTSDMIGFGVDGMDDVLGGSLGDGSINPFESLLNLIKSHEINYLNKIKKDT